jgi:putative sterol carrier protein
VIEPTRQFFRELARHHQPALESVTGTLRFDLADGERTEHWYVRVRKGDVTVSHKHGEADCTVSTDLATFEAIVAGRTNAMAAILRGAAGLEGRFLLLTVFQRLFPGPPEVAERPAAGYARRQS